VQLLRSGIGCCPAKPHRLHRSRTTGAHVSQKKSIAAVIVAAGRGTRAGGDVPKQYQMLNDRTVIAHTVSRFVGHPMIHDVVVVIHPDDAVMAENALPNGTKTVHGGATRATSVVAGLDAVVDQCTHVLIHDAARPLVSDRVIGEVIDALDHTAGAAPGIAVTDALWRADGNTVHAPHPRDGLFRAQTPQGFKLSVIRAAHLASDGTALDDVETALQAGEDVQIVPGDERNIKITVQEDFSRASKYLKDDLKMDIRMGTGYDVHAFGDGDHVVLCGVTIPFSRGLNGHSDADVGMHAITDAIYGALAEGDIGRHFPPSDMQWKGAESHIFLSHAVELAKTRGFRIGNVDCTLVCEQPKIGPHAEAMQTELARIMDTEVGRISVKATTSERLGFTGREEGIAALASAVLIAQ
jgi:2-C-methyl-D-erythritol 4-phosphate cytidylyltransferase/2-C-methyl-D-erythritol 2,4-cyclodiphosphate synthase